MDHDEEQRNECEALEAIFAQDFQLTSADPPRSFELVVVPNADGSNNHVSVRLLVELPATYPEVAASIRVRNERALLERQVAELTSLVAEKSAESVGEVAIYLIAEAVREWLVEHNQPVLSMHEQMEARANSKTNEEEERLAKRRALEARIEEKKKEPSPLGIEPGTLLTPESFAHWRALFDAEQRAIREAKEAAKPKMDRLTGKQLFLQNLARDLGEDEADKMIEESTAAQPKPELFCFNEGLFTDDVDDEDFEDGDEDEESDGEGEDDEDEEEEEEMASMFDTTTGAEKQMKAASISGGAGVGSSASSSSSSSSSSAAKKPAAAASSAAASSSSSSAAAPAPSKSAAAPAAKPAAAAAAPKPAAAAAAPAPSRSPPGFGGAQPAAAAAAPKPNQQQQQQQQSKPQPQKQQGGAGAGGKQQQQQAPQKGGAGGGGDKKKAGGKK